ncbi:MAG: tRNA dihydrouridine(20/20a) synthase DusA [Alphaproteobacteria bacterium]|nr:tRNA dihydrouridine(20/20a) synthase DusA [Alphaproteobacteria bacterium]
MNESARHSPLPPHTVSVAPMMGWTDRHDRYFMRQISPNALLYTVMLTTGALIYGKKLQILDYNPEEHPVALQLGGSDPKDMATCAKLARQYGYDEVNINCGCPSDRVQRGSFGACLMAEPEVVAESVDAMKQAVDIPVTVKTRIGIDNQDSYDFLLNFVGKIAEKGCETFIIHARKAWLNGLSPAENRTVPPLDYARVYQLKKDFPQLNIILNGGIKTIETIEEALEKLDGVMIGREAYQNPYFMAEVERRVFGTPNVKSRDEVIEAMMPYIERCLHAGTPLKDITRHMLGLYQGLPGARRWRRILSEEAYKPAANTNIVRLALRQVADL